jgi:3-oxoacyl-[acyl-carrier-protein] synthase II
MALENAGYSDRRVPPAEAERWGVYVGAGMGGLRTIEDTLSSYVEKGPRHGISPYFIPDVIVNLAPGLLSIKSGAQGPNMAHVSACSTGAHSIGEAMRLIQHEYADAMIAGGTEACVVLLAVGGFNAMRALSTRNDAPERASRPFERDRDGFVIAEGAGILVLEELGHAKKRGARIYAELVGYGATADAFHITQPAPQGVGAQQVMRRALADAKIAPEQVGYINAHGTSTPFNDKAETAAIKAVFTDHARRIAISSTKSMTGHTLGAAGGIEAAFAALVLQRRLIPPTINYETPDPECDLDYVPNRTREQTVDYVLSNSFGFGGTNAALLFKRFND